MNKTEARAYVRDIRAALRDVEALIDGRESVTYVQPLCEVEGMVSALREHLDPNDERGL